MKNENELKQRVKDISKERTESESPNPYDEEIQKQLKIKNNWVSCEGAFVSIVFGFGKRISLKKCDKIPAPEFMTLDKEARKFMPYLYQISLGRAGFRTLGYSLLIPKELVPELTDKLNNALDSLSLISHRTYVKGIFEPLPDTDKDKEFHHKLTYLLEKMGATVTIMNAESIMSLERILRDIENGNIPKARATATRKLRRLYELDEIEIQNKVAKRTHNLKVIATNIIHVSAEQGTLRFFNKKGQEVTDLGGLVVDRPVVLEKF